VKELLATTTSISIVVPVYSGESYLEDLVARIGLIRDQWLADSVPLALAEVILVDDGAVDGSPAIIDRLGQHHAWVVPLHLSRNYGQHSATVAGILYTAGDWVVTMDEDLQHPPEGILDLIRAAVLQGADVIYARPTSKVHHNPVRDLGSAGIKRLVATLSGNDHVPLINSFRLIRGEIGRSVASVAIHDTFFDIELGNFTNRIASVEMDLVDRRFVHSGKSGYRLGSLIAHARRMLMSSHLRVLNITTFVGAATLVLAMVCALGLVIGKIIWPDMVSVRGWASLMVSLMFFSGVNIAIIGIALQYLSTLVQRAHGRPTFFVIDRSGDRRLSRFFAGQLS
jgi:glycosyltransferase involved in cell wall biosynthesis